MPQTETLSPESVVKMTDILWKSGEAEAQHFAYNTLRDHFKTLANQINLRNLRQEIRSPQIEAPAQKVYPDTKAVIAAGLDPHDTKEYADQILKLFAHRGMMLSYESICSKIESLKMAINSWELAPGDYCLVKHGEGGSRPVYRRRISDALNRLASEKRLVLEGRFYCKP